MQPLRRVLLFGFLIWLIPFFAAFFIFPLRESNRPLFETLMPLILALCTTYFSVRHFRSQSKSSWQSGLTVGLVWALISFVIDLPIFLGAFATPFVEYLADIGLIYLLIPLITTAVSYGRE
jgi:hypothetical protein